MDLSIFNTASLFDAATDLFNQLNIQLNSNTSESLPARDVLKDFYREVGIFQEIQNTYFLGIIDESIFGEVGLFDERYSYKQALEQSERNYDGLMLFALELSKHPTRTEISDLTRAFNRISQKMPVGLLLKYDNSGEAVISITISERFKYKQNWRQGEKAGKVIILRDIHTITTHAGHIRILKDLVKPVAVTTYSQLHEHWLQVLDVNILNKRFFQELANWYFWAMDIVEFPDDVEKDKEVRNATNLIRLITRVIFIWFIKEKKLVPNNLFRKDYLQEIVVDFMKNSKSENFYQAILQNLFFGTLNQIIEDRIFVKEGSFPDNREEYGVKNLFRYSDKFSISKNEVKALFKDIPFLNGGLFDCLDKPDDDGKIIYVDGFSRNPKKQSHIPDYVFFSDEIEIDLNEIYGTRSKRYKVQGLVNLLDSYKFTVAENTPIEEEIALDPELLGKVFENLLASYNPETKTTARKQTGSFYTPREIVNYMVDESLIEYLKQNCNTDSQNFEKNLRNIFSYSEDLNPFEEEESKSIIKALNQCRILDPACGSGAFPMGILHKMVHILNKLDPENLYWKQLQKERAIAETNIAYDIKEHDARKRRLDEIEEVFENNISDYGRKLYLIENCIYGIDIQPIAVQIAKLRFFISLIIDQDKLNNRENFGIRSLPNLETKFVAANTLISLDKPQLTTGDIFLNDTYQKINALSAQLKEIRHRYFNAKIRDEKLKFQREDKKLRKKISDLLVKVGHTTINAHKIAAFDPYDQNHFADWFDPEWMFGKDIENGFNIIIGNPPYIAGKSGLLSESEKKYYNNKFETAEYQLDTYILFVEQGILLLKSNGVLTYIMPNTWLANIRLTKIRKFLLEKTTINEILIMPDDVFLTAVVDTTILFCCKKYHPKHKIKISSFKEWIHNSLYEIEQESFKENSGQIFDIGIDQSSRSLLKKISESGTLISEICDINRGVHAYRKDGYGKSKYGKGYQTERDYNEHSYHAETKLDNTYFREVRGKNILPFYHSFSGYYISWGDWLAEPREWKYFEGERIYLRKIVGDTLYAAYTESDNVADQSVYIAKVKKGKLINTKYLLGIINSHLLGWYFRVKANEFDDLFPQIKVSEFKALPIREVGLKEQEPLINLVNKIIKVKENNPETNLLDEVKQLNNMVYKIYNLTEQEINIVEKRNQ